MPKTVGVDPSPFTVRKPEETGKSVLGFVHFTFIVIVIFVIGLFIFDGINPFSLFPHKNNII